MGGPAEGRDAKAFDPSAGVVPQVEGVLTASTHSRPHIGTD